MSERDLWVAEHGWIRRGTVSRSDGGNLELAPDEFDGLAALADGGGTNPDDGGIPLAWVRQNGREYLCANNHVGVIRTQNGTQIELLPKVARSMDAGECRRTLVQMLIEARDAPFRRGTAAALQAHRMRLLDLLLRQFLDEVAVVLRGGLAQAYVSVEENLSALRGKLLVNENTRLNAANAARLYCEYEILSPDRPINRLVRTALDVVRVLARGHREQQLARELHARLQSVPASMDWRRDWRSMHWDRNTSHYARVMPLCGLILERMNPLTRKGENSVVSVLFPMERVFEEFVVSRLRRYWSGARVRAQVDAGHLVEDHAGTAAFGLKPDIVIDYDGRRIIADTKWKLIGLTEAPKASISQADAYQMFAYCKQGLPGSSDNEVWLIYPRTPDFPHALAPFAFDHSRNRMLVLPFDLDRGEIVFRQRHAS